MRLLLTGNPGVGKTTVIRAVLERLGGITRAGFYTEEIRQGGQRTGFRIVTLNGEQKILASLRKQGPTVGKYSVHVDEFEKLALGSLDPSSGAEIYIIDEIGKMELLSRRFTSRIGELLAQPAHLLSTISKKGNGFIDRIKTRSDVEMIEVTRLNRDGPPETLARRIKRELGP